MPCVHGTHSELGTAPHRECRCIAAVPIFVATLASCVSDSNSKRLLFLQHSLFFQGLFWMSGFLTATPNVTWTPHTTITPSRYPTFTETLTRTPFEKIPLQPINGVCLLFYD